MFAPIVKVAKPKQLLISAEKAAPMLSVSAPHLRALATEHKIPHVRLGDRILFSVIRLKRWIREQQSDRESLALRDSQALDRLLDTKEVARLYSVHPKTVTTWNRTEPGKKIPRARYPWGPDGDPRWLESEIKQDQQRIKNECLPASVLE